MSIVDLHIHTNKSDGAHEPKEVIRFAFDAGVQILSITDHDTIGGLAEAEAEATALGISFIPGLEISTKARHEQHILGYAFDPAHAGMRAFLRMLMDMRLKREQETLNFLWDKGVKIRAEDVRKFTRSVYIGRPHIAAAMVEAGYASDVKDAFSRYLATEDYMKINRPRPTSEEGIAAIRKAGGIAALAHPHSLKLDDDELSAAVAALKAEGLGAIECYYGTYGPEQNARYLKLAKKYDLVVTGGSDFHGQSVKPGILIGTGRSNLLNFNDTGIIEKLRRG